MVNLTGRIHYTEWRKQDESSQETTFLVYHY